MKLVFKSGIIGFLIVFFSLTLILSIMNVVLLNAISVSVVVGIFVGFLSGLLIGNLIEEFRSNNRRQIYSSIFITTFYFILVILSVMYMLFSTT